jgi:hypothetical protein
MSDYKSMRMKKNRELEEALTNVKKDLYDWKPPTTNLFKPSINKDVTSQNQLNRQPSATPLFPAPPTRIKSLESTLKLKRTNSLKDLAKHANRIRPLSGVGTNKKPSLGFVDSDLLVEDLDHERSTNEFVISFGPDFRGDDGPSTDRPYLNTTRTVATPGPASFRDASDRESDLVIEIAILIQTQKTRINF